MLIRGSQYFYSDHLISRDITALLTPRGRLTARRLSGGGGAGAQGSYPRPLQCTVPDIA